MRTPPAAPSVRLSGTNNIPIGTRNKPLGNAPSLPQSNMSRVAVISGSNAEPILSHPRFPTREGPPVSATDLSYMSAYSIDSQLRMSITNVARS